MENEHLRKHYKVRNCSVLTMLAIVGKKYLATGYELQSKRSKEGKDNYLTNCPVFVEASGQSAV